MEWPIITVCIITYNRPELIRKILSSLRDHLHYPNLHLHLADDGSHPPYHNEVLREFMPHFKGTSYTVTDRGGWGRNANTALQHIIRVNGPLTYFQEDDYLLTTDLDLTTGVLLLQARSEVGMVRYRGITGHRVIAHLREFDTPDELHLRQGLSLPNRFCYWELDHRAPELWLYSHGPHLKDVSRLHGTYGFYAEGRKLGATEEEFAHRVKDGSYPVRIAVFPEFVPMLFDHIGQSYQLTEEDKGMELHV